MSTFTHICVAGTNVPVWSGTFVPVCKNALLYPVKPKFYVWCYTSSLVNQRKDVLYCWVPQMKYCTVHSTAMIYCLVAQSKYSYDILFLLNQSKVVLYCNAQLPNWSTARITVLLSCPIKVCTAMINSTA